LIDCDVFKERKEKKDLRREPHTQIKNKENGMMIVRGGVTTVTRALLRSATTTSAEFGRQLSSSSASSAKVLVVAEPSVIAATQCAVGAAGDSNLNADGVDVLVLGGSGEEECKLPGVASVKTVNHTVFGNEGKFTAEAAAAAIAPLSEGYSTVVVAATSWGKNVLPRAAALAGVQPVTDVVKFEGDDSYTRPIYAGNALQTVKYVAGGAADGKARFVSVRTTSFEPVADEGGSAVTEAVDPPSGLDDVAARGQSKWVSEERRESERPTLGSARVV